MAAPSTQSESVFATGPEGKPIPGGLLVFSDQAPMLRAFPVAPGPVVLGRDDSGGTLALPDDKASRRHAQIIFDGPGWTIKDLGSRNGTFVDGRRVDGEMRAATGAVVRMAQSVVILHGDVRRFLTGTVSTDGAVIGPTLRGALDRIAVAARGGATVLIGGESGSGKEMAARIFHEATGAKGPLVAVNCATITGSLAERQLFGARKGVYTDVKEDADGFVQAADGGTLFLDEVGELDPQVQAKLLRTLETGEVTRLGDAMPRKVKVRFVAATHRNLRQAIERGAFRSDLYFRLAQVEVQLPPLRERREEIPFLASQVLAQGQIRVAHASLVETLLLRPWPGNVRELLAQVKKATLVALGDGSKSIRDLHLDPEAGIAARSGGDRDREPSESEAHQNQKMLSKEELLTALERHGWNVAEAARSLDEHRNQINRLIKRYGIRRPGPGVGDAE